PESARVWTAADRVASLAGVATDSFHPVAIDPSETGVQLFLLTAYAAMFIIAMLLVRDGRPRVALMVGLASMAVVEGTYAVRLAATQRYEIGGWRNTLIFNRAPGTFVNPNHFAHYTAIILPFAVLLCALAWHAAAGPGTPFTARFARMIERHYLLCGVGA